MLLALIDGYLIELHPGTGPWSKPSRGNTFSCVQRDARPRGAVVLTLGLPA